MNLNMSKFKKLSEDKKSATFQHPDGHKITVAKHVLSAGMRGELSKIPLHLAEGGDVPDQEQDAQPQTQGQPTVVINTAPQPAPGPAPIVAPQPIPQAAPMEAAPMAAPSSAQDWQGSAGHMAAPQPEAPAMPAVAPKPQSQGAYGQFMQGISEQKRGLQQEAQHLGEQGQAEAKIADQAAQNAQMLQQTTQASLDKISQHREELTKAYSDQHIDPMRAFHQMGTGQKVMTAIGLILGGLGSGFNHGANPALDMMNKLIANDIDAQKAEMGKSKTLLDANQQDFGNSISAAQMARINQQDTVSYLLKKAAAEASDPLAKDRALKAAGAIDADSAQKMQQLGATQAAMQMMGGSSGSSAGADPAQKIRMMSLTGMIDPKQRDAALKELSQHEEMVKARDNALGVFNKLDKNNTALNRLTSPVQTSRQVSSARDNIAVQIARDEAGRVNEYEFKAAQDLFPSPGDNEETLRSKKQDLLNTIQKKMNSPNLKALGIQLDGGGRYNDHGERKLQLGAPVPMKR